MKIYKILSIFILSTILITCSSADKRFEAEKAKYNAERAKHEAEKAKYEYIGKQKINALEADHELDRNVKNLPK